MRVLMAGVTQGLSEWWNFTNLGGNIRSIACTNCDVKDVARSSTVAVGPSSLNQSWLVAHLPKASIQDRGYRRTKRLIDLVCKPGFDFVKSGDHVTILWSEDPSGARTWGAA